MTAQVPAGFESTSADVGVSVPSGSNTFTASAYVTVRSAADVAGDKASAAAPQPVRAGPLALSTNVVLGGVAAIGVGLMGAVGVLAVGNKPATNLTLSEQIQAYGVMAVPESGRPPPRRRTRHGDRRSGPPGRGEGAGQQQEPRGPHRRIARVSGGRPPPG